MLAESASRLHDVVHVARYAILFAQFIGVVIAILCQDLCIAFEFANKIRMAIQHGLELVKSFVMVIATVANQCRHLIDAFVEFGNLR